MKSKRANHFSIPDWLTISKLVECEAKDEGVLSFNEQVMRSPEEYLEKSLVYGYMDSVGVSVNYDKDPPMPILEEERK